jgi:hypothetical protein
MSKSAAEIRREKLRARQTQAVQNRDKTGLGKKSVLDWSKLTKKKPAEFIPEAKKTHLFDLLPFIVTQPWYKNLRTKSGLTTGLDIGEWDYKLEIPVHKYVGENNDTFICLREAFGNKCPICDDMFEEYAKETPDKEKARNLNCSWRNYFNIYDYNNPDADIHVWEDASYALFEKEFLGEAGDHEEMILYSDIEDGRSIQFKGKEASIGKNKFVETKNIEFLERDPYDEDIVNDTISFDSLVIIPTYEDVLKAYKATESSEPSETDIGETEETPKTESKSTSRRERVQKKAEPEKNENECPEGLDFGYDCDPAEDKCTECPEDLFNRCADKKEEIEMDGKASDKSAEPEPEPENELQRDEKKEAGGRRERARTKPAEQESNSPTVTRKRTRR